MNNKLDDTFVIMGIDPGTNIMGFGIIKVEKKEMTPDVAWVAIDGR